MGWQGIARSDGSEAIRPKLVKYLLALPVIAIVITAYAYPVSATPPFTTARFGSYVTGTVTTVVPVTGILLGYNAVVSDRESGALLLLLALPVSREDLVLGKYASRLGLLSASLLISMVLAGGLVVYPFGRLVLVPYVALTIVTLGYGAIWAGLGVAASLVVATKQRALIVAFALLFLFVLAWDAVRLALTVGLRQAGIIDTELPDLLQFLFGLGPGSVYNRVVEGFIDPSGTVAGPWYLGEWMALVLFVLWIVGPLGLAYRRFAGRDIA